MRIITKTVNSKNSYGTTMLKFILPNYPIYQEKLA
jgi:hypothetical protein